MSLRTLLIDDESNARGMLRKLLDRHCPDVSIAGECRNVVQALEALPRELPDLVFLDVEMPDGTGFDLLERLGSVPFKVIFTTAHNEYAVRAIRFSALDFLLKPVDPEELTSAVARAVSSSATEDSNARRLHVLREHLRQDRDAPERIALPTIDGFGFVEVRDIIRCVASSNYTEFHLQNKARVTVCRTLREYDELLTPFGFARIHHSTLINLAHLRRYVKGKGGYVVMSDGSELEVSVRRKEEFLKALGM
jgi:two-component system LytT family response regulator